MALTKEGFEKSMDDDFNSAGALGYLFELIRSINTARAENASDKALTPAQNLLSELIGILGLNLKAPAGDSSTSGPFIDYLVELRTTIRNQKLYELSDQIRNRLATLKVIIEDTKDGSSWHWE